MDIDKCREAFEAHVLDDDESWRSMLDRYEDDDAEYMDSDVQYRWLEWQAACWLGWKSARAACEVSKETIAALLEERDRLREAIGLTLDELQEHPMFMGYEASEDEIDSEGGDAAFVTVIGIRLNEALAEGAT